eukprot:jgi/Psemu1/45743/gm1.45743_g
MSYSVHLHNNFGRNRFTTPKTLTLADYSLTAKPMHLEPTEASHQPAGALLDVKKSVSAAHEADQSGMEGGKPPARKVGQVNAADDEMLNKDEDEDKDEDEIPGNKDNDTKTSKKLATQQNVKILVWSAPANGNALEKLKQRRALKGKTEAMSPRSYTGNKYV